MYSFKLLSCSMLGGVKVVVWIEKTVWSSGERLRLEDR